LPAAKQIGRVVIVARTKRQPLPGEDAMYQAFGLAVRNARQKKGLTQSQCAEAMGVSTVWFCEMERGKAKVFLADALYVASMLNVPLRAVRMKGEAP
jgi:DNA-binding XRE family transcriptional regulator